MAAPTLSKLRAKEAADMGRHGCTPHDAYAQAEAAFGTGRNPKGAALRRAFVELYQAAFDAEWTWQVTDWNARGNASGRVIRKT